MKIRNFFLAVMTLALTVSGCSKVDTPAADNDLKFVFEIADKDGFGTDTKAIKTGWADGDQVVILFKPTGAEECLVQKSGDNKWPKTAMATYNDDQGLFDLIYNMEKNDLETSGKYYAIHYRSEAYLDIDDEAGMDTDCFPLNTAPLM